jgi:eukaryotic-like serine/threonine-protein kinase
VDKFIGDAVMAVFRGKDHLERAIDACLAMRAQIAAMAAITTAPSPYAHGLAVGLNTGELIAGSIGSQMLSRLDYTVLGEVVTTAAHHRAIASRGQIVISEALHGVVSEAFICERLLPRHGELGPEIVYNVLRRADTAERVSDGPTVPMEATAEEPLDVTLRTSAPSSRK